MQCLSYTTTVFVVCPWIFLKFGCGVSSTWCLCIDLSAMGYYYTLDLNLQWNFLPVEVFLQFIFLIFFFSFARVCDGIGYTEHSKDSPCQNSNSKKPFSWSEMVPQTRTAQTKKSLAFTSCTSRYVCCHFVCFRVCWKSIFQKHSVSFRVTHTGWQPQTLQYTYAKRYSGKQL